MIKRFRHKGLKRFFETGSTAGITASHAVRLSEQLAVLDHCTAPEEMDLPGWHLHRLTQNLKGHWAVKVNANWRLTFAFEGEDAIEVDYEDYH